MHTDLNAAQLYPLLIQIVTAADRIFHLSAAPAWSWLSHQGKTGWQQKKSERYRLPESLPRKQSLSFQGGKKNLFVCFFLSVSLPRSPRTGACFKCEGATGKVFANFLCVCFLSSW